MGSVVPAIAPEPSGHSLAFAGDLGQAGAVALEHLQPREEVMRRINGLRPLQVRVARDEDVSCLLGAPRSARWAPSTFAPSTEHACLKNSRMSVATWSLRLRAVCSFDAAGTRLVSACSMFMWTSSSRSSQTEASGLYVPQDRSKPGVDGLALPGCDQPDAGEHRRMGLAARDVKRRQPAVKRGGLAEFQHEGRRDPP